MCGGASTASSRASATSTAAPLRSNRSATNSCKLPIAPSRSFEVFAEQRLVERLGALVLPSRLQQATTERSQRLVTACIRHLQPGVQHQLREIAILIETAKDRSHFAHHELEHRDFLVEQMKKLLLQRAASHEVEDEQLALLADAIDASNALLDRHRIPGHVKIDERVAKLNVASFATGLGAQEDRHLRAELLDGAVLFGTAQASFEAREGNAFPAQQVGEMVQRVAIIDKDQLLPAGISPQQSE